MRKWNKLLALVLAMVMVFGLTATAFATEGDSTAPTQTEDKKDDAAEPTEGEDKKDETKPEGEDKKDETKPEGEDKKDEETKPEGEDKKPEDEKAGYADVESHWGKDAINAILAKGLVDAKDETSFDPEGGMTRGALVEALYRLAEKPELAEDAEVKEFTDVAADHVNAAAIAWASANGVVGGYEDNTFAPDATLTRSEIAAVLFRYLKAEAVEEDKLAAFSDADKVEAWAVDAMNWAVANKLINGNSDGSLNPNGTATRAEVATILNNYITNLVDKADATEPTEPADPAAEPTEPAEDKKDDADAKEPAGDEDKPAEGQDVEKIGEDIKDEQKDNAEKAPETKPEA